MAYSNARYRKQDTLQLRKVPKIPESTVQALEPQKALIPLEPIKSVAEQRRVYAQQNEQTQTFLANYNDPTELNSYIDALTNRVAVSKKFGEAWGIISTVSGTVAVLSFAGSIIATALAPFTGGASLAVAAPLAKIGTVAALPSIPAAADVTIEKGIKPIVAGKPKEAGLNMMMNLGETMDFAANPIKGLVLEGPEGFIKATGLSDEGRVNYDYDTGFFLTDMLLEIVSDPTTWVDLGTGAFVKNATKEIGSEASVKLSTGIIQTIETTFEGSTKNITKQTVQQLEENLAKDLTLLAREWREIPFKNLTQEAQERILLEGRIRLQNSIVDVLKKDLDYEQIQIVFERMQQNHVTQALKKINAYTLQDITFDTLSSNVIKGLSAVQHLTNSGQKALNKAALLSSGFGAPLQLIRENFPAIKKWASEHVLNRLQKLKAFTRATGVDLAKWDLVKTVVQQEQEYITDIAGNVVVHNLDTAYTLLTEQLNRDKNLVYNIVYKQHPLDPVKQALALDTIFTNVYGYDYNTFLAYVEKINSQEGGVLNSFVDFFKTIRKNTEQDALEIQLNLSKKQGAQLYHTKTTEQFIEHSIKQRNKIVADIKRSKNIKDFAEDIKSLKVSDDAATSLLLDNEIIQNAAELVNDTTQGLGALLTNITGAPERFAQNNSAIIGNAAEIVLKNFRSMQNTIKLRDDIAKLAIPKIQGITEDEIRLAIINEIFGLKYSPTELLAGFDDITMFNLIENVDTLLNTDVFKLRDMPELVSNINQIYRNFLLEQERIGVDIATFTFSKDFTRSIADLATNLPVEYADVILPLTNARAALEQVLLTVKKINNDLSYSVLANVGTIYQATSERQLMELGYAQKTIAHKENMKYFAIPQNISDPMLLTHIDEIGAKINRYVDGLVRYNVNIGIDDTVINKVYKNVYFTFLRNKELYFPDRAFRFLVLSDNTNVQLAQLALIKKAIAQEPSMREIFGRIFRETKNNVPAHLNKSILLNRISNLESYFVTDFTWEPKKQTAWAAALQFEKDTINAHTQYKQLAQAPRAAQQSLYVRRQELSKSGLDIPQRAQNERHIKRLEPFIELFDFIPSYYDALYDYESAQQIIEDVTELFLKYPNLYEKYKPTLYKLKQYWLGDLEFEQTPKKVRYRYADRLAELQNIYKNDQETIQEILRREFPEGIKDTFSVFNDEVKELNRTYIEYQRQQYTEEFLYRWIKSTSQNPSQALRNLKSRFTKNPVFKQQVFALFNDHNLAITEENFQIYKSFLDSLALPKDSPLPMELLPNMFKEGLFKQLHEQYGIADIRLVYAFMNGTTGGSVRYALDKTFVPNITLSTVAAKSLTEFTRIIDHELTHNVFRFLPNEIKEKVFNFAEAGLRRITGDARADKFIKGLLKKYSKNYDYPITLDTFAALKEHDPAAYVRMQEEFVAFIRGQNVTTSTETHAALEQLNAELTELLKPGILQLPAQEYLNTRVKDTLRDVKTFNTWTPFKKQQEFNKALNQATERNTLANTYRLLQLTPEELEQELATRVGHVLIFNSQLTDKNVQRAFVRLKKAIDPTKIHITTDPNLQAQWIYLDKNQKIEIANNQVYLNSAPIIRPHIEPNFNEFEIVDRIITDSKNPGIVNTLSKLNSMSKELLGTGIEDSQGLALTEKVLTGMYEYMPEEVRKHISLEMLSNPMFYESKHFYNSVFGTVSEKTNLGLYSGRNMLINMRNAVTQIGQHTNARTEYTQMFFNSMMSINSPNSIWANLSDEQIFKGLQANPEYKALILVDDKKYGLKVREVLPTSVQAIQKLRELGGVILPAQVAKEAYKRINHRIGSSGLAKLWSRLIYMYKFGYLCSPGAWIRNFIDTNLKTILDLDDKTAHYQSLSHGIINEYESIKDFIIKRRKWNELHGATETLDQMYQAYFKNTPTKFLNYESFKELELKYFSQGLSDNIMAELVDTTGGDAWQTFTHLTGKIVDAGNQTEKFNRLAVYLAELDKGVDYTSALAKVAKVHFDYSFKTNFEQLIEMVFPFTTFTLRNYSYWFEMLEKHPWILRNYTHLMKPHWDFKDYSPEELATNYRVQNQILRGQLKLAEFNDKVITFKANPSIQDALQMFSDPINNVYEKLAAPISVPLNLAQGEYTQPANIIPVLGPMIQAAQTMVKTKSPLPSAIGVSKAPRRTGKKDISKTFRNKNYNGMNSYRDKQYRTPNYRKNVIYDAYATKGITRYRTNFYPIVDIAHDVKMSYSVNVASKIKNKVKTDVYQGIRYSLRLDANKFK